MEGIFSADKLGMLVDEFRLIRPSEGTRKDVVVVFEDFQIVGKAAVAVIVVVAIAVPVEAINRQSVDGRVRQSDESGIERAADGHCD